MRAGFKLAVITKLQPQKNRKRVSLFLDGKFGFGLSLEEVVKNGLKTGKELGEKKVEELFFSSQREKVLGRVLNFLSYRPRSEREVRRYMWKRFKLMEVKEEWKEKLKKEILKKLRKQKLLDDASFADWWIEQRI